MSVTYHGVTDALIRLPEDTLAIQPSRLAILQRKYACAEDYVGTARARLVPGSGCQGYPYLKLYRKPVESRAAGIVTFTCSYYGYLSPGDLKNPTLDWGAGRTTITVKISRDINGTADNTSNDLSIICPLVTLSYITTDPGISVLAAPSVSLDQFYIGAAIPPAALIGAPLIPGVQTYEATTYQDVTEIRLTYLYTPLLRIIYYPSIIPLSAPTLGTSLGSRMYRLNNYQQGGVYGVYTVSGAATLAVTTTAGVPTYTLTTAAPTSSDQTFTLALSYPGNVPSGYDPLTDYRVENPPYYEAANNVSTFLIKASGSGGVIETITTP
jgi:hypothetical protein